MDERRSPEETRAAARRFGRIGGLRAHSPAGMARPLADLSDAELADYLAQSAENVVYSYADLLAEADRRHARRVADANVRFARIAIIIATVSVFVSAVGIVVSVLR